MEDAATPFPREETTPPVTKIYFGVIRSARAWNANQLVGLVCPPQECRTINYVRKPQNCQFELFARSHRYFF